MSCFLHPKAWLVVAVLLASGNAGWGQASFKLPPVGALVMAPDDRTLVVSLTSSAMLAYFDTVDDKQIREVEVEFQPTSLAVQGQLLFAAAKGAATIHVLDLATGKEAKKIRLSGEPVRNLACHPQQGLLYAVNLKDEVFAIDPIKAESFKTAAKGQLLAVDCTGGKYVYTGVQKPIRDVIVIRERPRNTLHVSLATANISALMLEYEVTGHDLKLLAANDNAAANGRGMGLSPSGKQIAMAGGGGWRSKTDPHANYSIAVFDTADMNTLLGQIETGPYPSAVAFHPRLRLGVAYRDSKSEVIFFNARSFAKKYATEVPESDQTPLMTFGGQGTKLVYASVPHAPGSEERSSELLILPLDLSEQDRQMLKSSGSP